MTKEIGYDLDVGTVLQDVCCETVSCTVPCDMLADSSCLGPFPEMFKACGVTWKIEQQFVF